MLLTRLSALPPSLRFHAAELGFFGGVLWLLSGPAIPAWGKNPALLQDRTSLAVSAPNAKDALISFDLPAQPLAKALEQYGAISGQSVMFVDSLVTGRMASPVQGRYTPRAALQALLAGTGLAAVDVSKDQQSAFTLRLATIPTNVRARGKLEHSYDGVVQARVWEALCADSRTVPGHYRAILRFLVSSSGRIQRAGLISSTGDEQRDAAILTVVARLRLGSPPPPNLAQPLTLVILPHDVLPGPTCQRKH